MKTISIFTLLAWVFTLPPGLKASEPLTVYPVQPMVVNERYQMQFQSTVKIDQSQDLGAAGMKEYHFDYSGKIEGIVWAPRVNAQGGQMEVRLTIKTAEFTKDGQSSAMFKAGDEIVIRRAAQQLIIDVNGVAAAPDQLAFLVNMMDAYREDEPFLGDILNTKEKVLPGSRWEISGALAAAYFAQHSGIKLVPANTAASVLFKGPGEYRGRPAHEFEVEYQSETKDYRPPNTEKVMAPKVVTTRTMRIMAAPGPRFSYGQSKTTATQNIEYAGTVETRGTMREVSQMDLEPVK